MVKHFQQNIPLRLGLDPPHLSAKVLHLLLRLLKPRREPVRSRAAACTQGGKEDLAPVVFCGEGGGVLTRRWSGRPGAAAFLEFGV